MDEKRTTGGSRKGEVIARSAEQRVLTVRLSPGQYDFLLEEGIELALEQGKGSREEIEAEAKDIRKAFKANTAKGRGLIVFSDVIENALEALRSYGLLPSVAMARLERDREALRKATRSGRLSRYQYLQLVLYARSEEVAKKGPGFDRKDILVEGG